MSEYLHVEKTFLDQLASLGWTVIDQGRARFLINQCHDGVFRLLFDFFLQAGMASLEWAKPEV